MMCSVDDVKLKNPNLFAVVTVQEDTSLANQQETQAHELDAVYCLLTFLRKQSNTILFSMCVK